jgi:predicted Zn-dependent protease
LNAFAAPGGQMYFYTALIKFLDDGAQFAGVMAHEIAHADRRHSTENMTKQYGISLLLGILLGDNAGQLAEIAASLATGVGMLAFSRENEYEADEYAVRYTTDTEYYPKGIAGFFEKLGESSGVPEFLSTHPDPGNRLEAIDEVWQSLGSPAGESFASEYAAFKTSLP